MIGEEQKILCKEIGFDAALESAYQRGYNAGQVDAFEAATSTRKDLQQRLEDKGKQIDHLEKEAAASAYIKEQLRERINFLEDKQKTQLQKEIEQSKELVKKNNDLLEMQKAFDQWKGDNGDLQAELYETIAALKTEIRSLRAQMGRAGVKPAKPRKGR